MRNKERQSGRFLHVRQRSQAEALTSLLQVVISLGALQRLIALKAIPLRAIPQILVTMLEIMGQGVDIQLRILQALLSLVTNFPEVHGTTLGEVSSTTRNHLGK